MATLFLFDACSKWGRHFYTIAAPSCCVPPSYCHPSATLQTMSITVANFQDNRAVFRIFLALLMFSFDSPSYSSVSKCYCYQKKKRAKPGSLPKSNALSEMGGRDLGKNSLLLCPHKIIINRHTLSVTLLTEEIFSYEGLCSMKVRQALSWVSVE